MNAIEKGYTRIFKRLSRHRFLATVVLVSLYLFVFRALSEIRLDSSITSMVSGDPAVRRSLNFLRARGEKYDIAIHLRREAPRMTRERLIEVSDSLAARLRREKMNEVLNGVDQAELFENPQALARYLPAVFSSSVSEAVLERIQSDRIHEKIQTLHRRMLLPGMTADRELLRLDPLDLRETWLEKLGSLATASGFRVNRETGRFLNTDGKSALVLVDSRWNAMDSEKSKKALAVVHRAIEETVPAGIRAYLLSPHVHAAANERILRKDVRLCLAGMSAALLVLLFAVFRDLRAAWVFLVPAASLVPALVLTGWLNRGVSAVALGFGAVIAGIAVDYGIHLFSSLRSGAPPEKAFPRIHAPLLQSLFTTAAAFVPFLFSSVPGYRQIGQVTLAAIGLSFCLGIFVLPGVFRSRTSPLPAFSGPLPGARFSKAALYSWFLLIAAAAVAIPSVRLKTELKQLDGTPDAVFHDEAFFRKCWNMAEPVFLAVRGASKEDALRKNDRLSRDLLSLPPEYRRNTLSGIYPSSRTAARNTERWNAFWKKHSASLKANLLEISTKAGFSKNAFLPFYEWIATPRSAPPAPMPFLERIASNYVLTAPGETWVLSPVDPETAKSGILASLIEESEDRFLFSENALLSDIQKAMQSETRVLALLALVLAVGSLRATGTGTRRIALSLLPALTSLVLFLGGSARFGLVLNPLHLAALVIVLGLAVDYGVFMVHVCRSRDNRDAVRGVSLSALTTLFGSGILLGARHPVLRSLGVPIFFGVLTAWIAALVFVPAFDREFPGARNGQCAKNDTES